MAFLSLALGIGANTAIFSIVNAVLLRPSPAEDRERLAEVYTSDDDGIVHAMSSYTDVVDLRRATDVFEDVLGYGLFIAQVERAEGAGMLVLGELVTGNYFSMLGIRPAIGRAFAPVEDSVPLVHPIVILGREFWRTASLESSSRAGPSECWRTLNHHSLSRSTSMSASMGPFLLFTALISVLAGIAFGLAPGSLPRGRTSLPHSAMKRAPSPATNATQGCPAPRSRRPSDLFPMPWHEERARSVFDSPSALQSLRASSHDRLRTPPRLLGGAFGLLLAAGGTSLVARFLFGIDALDFVAFAGAPAVLLCVALLASWIPARRAARLDPQTALRS